MFLYYTTRNFELTGIKRFIMSKAETKPATQHPLMEELNTYITVDVETSGPAPGLYSLLSIGACTVAKPHQTFYIELIPVNDQVVEEAMSVNQLSMEMLKEKGTPPAEALHRFENWISQVVPAGLRPIFLAFNAPFDWMFVNDYFYRYLGHNPFGHSALDIKAFYMGQMGVPWKETSHRYVSRRYMDDQHLTHHALQDAIDEAEIFRRMIEEISGYQ